jgi:hypothetical protein
MTKRDRSNGVGTSGVSGGGASGGPNGGGFRRLVRGHRGAVTLGVLCVVVGLLWLALGYFEFQKAFIDDKVNDAAPAGGAAASAQGVFLSRAHATTGSAMIIPIGDGQTLRLADLMTENGPDVRVYLAAGTAANGEESVFDDDVVDLGSLKGNIGSQNYVIPEGTDLTKYNTVVLWCRRFSVAFGAADLKSQ